MSEGRGPLGAHVLQVTVSERVLGCHKLRPVHEGVEGSRRQLMVHSCSLQLVSLKDGPGGTEGSGEIKKKDSHSAAWLLQVRENMM